MFRQEVSSLSGNNVHKGLAVSGVCLLHEHVGMLLVGVEYLGLIDWRCYLTTKELDVLDWFIFGS